LRDRMKSKTEVTDYKLNDRPLLTGRKKGRREVQRNPEYYPYKLKVEACTIYSVLGDVDKVAEKLSVPALEITKWKKEDWWHELTKEIYTQIDESLLRRINDLTEQTLVMLEDRILNGDCVEDRTTGDVRRIPVKSRDLAQIFNALSNQKNHIRELPEARRQITSVSDKLNKLLENFESIGQGRLINGECEEVKE